jgi:hypothetical protein
MCHRQCLLPVLLVLALLLFLLARVLTSKLTRKPRLLLLWCTVMRCFCCLSRCRLLVGLQLLAQWHL